MLILFSAVSSVSIIRNSTVTEFNKYLLNERINDEWTNKEQVTEFWARSLRNKFSISPLGGDLLLLEIACASREHKILKLTVSKLFKSLKLIQRIQSFLASRTLQISLDHTVVPDKWAFLLLISLPWTILKSLLLQFVYFSLGLRGDLAVTAHVLGKTVSMYV